MLNCLFGSYLCFYNIYVQLLQEIPNDKAQFLPLIFPKMTALLDSVLRKQISLQLYQIAKESKSTNTSSFWAYV